MNELPKINLADRETGCCPRFDPEPWDEKAFEFENLPFVKAHNKSLFHIPLDIGKVMSRAMRRITEAKAETTDTYLILSRDLSPWRSEHYFLVTKPVDGMETESLSGLFLTKVFEGGFGQLPKWMKDMENYVTKQGRAVKNLYAFYTTCPKCAKRYGKNYVVLFAEV